MRNKILGHDPSVSTQILSEDGAVLYHSDTGKEKVINPTGLFVWQKLNGSRNAADITNEIKKDFESVQSEQVKADVDEFLQLLESEGFALPRSSGTSVYEQNPEFPDFNAAPKSLDLALTGKCNLQCAYCFYNDEMNLRPDVDKETWLKFFKELGSLAVRDATLSGGEIFVRPDLWELIDGLVTNRMRYSINTNGTLITEKTLRSFEQGKRRIRLDSIQVSIDGSCAEVHDKSRGQGTFKKAIQGLRLLKEAKFPVTVRATINRHNVDDLNNIARLLLEDIGIPSFSTNDAMPMGSGCENQPEITLTPQQQVQTMKDLAGLAEKYDGRVTAMAGPLAKWRSYQEMEHAMKTGEKSTRWQMGYLTACGCMFNKLSVHHDGIITPCNMLTKLEMGKINTDSFSEIWQQHQTLKDLKDRRKIPMTQVPGCEDCEWAEFCNGSCPGLAFEMTGDFNLANPHDCYRKFLRETGGIDFKTI
ncbi:MAG: SynChlorMet cassette radical SAM/SPASM protein ScmE [Desulfobacteraceae bacterium]|nr:SynChlorMet cassette radical SAM/SPASM protein ScmE [Desulfobacteraceae bacterium]